MRSAKMQFARHLLPSTTPMHQLSSSDRYRLFAQSANEHAIIITDVEGRIMEWSAGAEKLLGWSAAQAVGQPVLMIYTQEDRDSGAAEAELSGARQYGCSSDVRLHLRRDGSTVFCDGIVNQVFADDTTTVVGYGKIMREVDGRSVEVPYAYDHDTPEGFAGHDFWPDELAPQSFYEPVDRGFERKIRERLAYWSGLKTKKQAERGW